MSKTNPPPLSEAQREIMEIVWQQWRSHGERGSRRPKCQSPTGSQYSPNDAGTAGRKGMADASSARTSLLLFGKGTAQRQSGGSRLTNG